MSRWYSNISQIAWACDQLIKGKRIGHYQLKRGTDTDKLELPKSFNDYLKNKPRDE